MTGVYLRNDGDFAAVDGAWKAGRPVVITGAAGIGKTRLAREFAASIGRRPVWIIGTAAMASTPFGALTAAIGDDDLSEHGTVVDRLRAMVADGGMVIVESAEHLDSASAAVVARLICTVSHAGVITAGGPVGEPLSRELAAAGAAEVAMSPFDLASATAFVEARLGGMIATVDAIRLHRASDGVAFVLGELVDGAVRADVLRSSDGMWQLCGDLAVTDDLRALGTHRLSAASEVELQLIDLLTLCDPLPMTVVEHLGLAGGVSRVEGGLVLPLVDTVVPGHAILVEQRRAEMGRLERRVIAGRLVAAMNAVDIGPVVRLHRTRLSLDVGVPVDCAALTGGATVAFGLGDLGLTERLAQAAVDAGGGLAARLQLARAKTGLGLPDQARAALADIDPDSLEVAELTAFAVTLAYAAVVGAGEPAQALSILDKFEPRVDPPVFRAAFTGMRALAHLNADDPHSALWSARRAQAPGVKALVWASLGTYVALRISECVDAFGELA